jgi:hypothetical protein
MPLLTEQHVQQYRAKEVTILESALPASLIADYPGVYPDRHWRL